MKSSLKLFIIGMIAALIGSQTAADPLPPPWVLITSADCSPTGVQISVRVINYGLDTGSTFIVYRSAVVPGPDGRYDLTPEPVALPPLGDSITLTLTDPAMDAESTGFYVAEFRWPDGSLAGDEEAQLSCGQYEFLVRGYLLTNDTVLPCQGMGMLECTSVELFYGDLNAWVGSGELLDFYGMATSFNAVDDCAVQVHAIEPVGPGAVCGSPIPDERVPWGALKAQYR